MPQYPTDIEIINSLIFDGSGGEPFSANILVKDGLIASIGNGRFSSSAITIDARGLAVSPGFIDTHTHSEFTLLADHRAEGKILQGVTTEISGNCGLSAGPFLGESKTQREADFLEFSLSDRWSYIDEYFVLLEKNRIALNYATLAGHGNIRASVIGYENRPPTPYEISLMKDLLKNAIDHGAIGLSTGLIYPPGVYSKPDELAELTAFGYRYAESKGLPFIYASHMASEGDRLIESIEGMIDICRKTVSPVHVSHIKTSGKANWHKASAVAEIIESAVAGGLRITADRYPYTASSTDLDSILPSSAFEGGNIKALEKLHNPAQKNAIREEVLRNHPEPDYWQRAVVSSVDTEDNRWMEGKSIDAIAKRLSIEPVDALLQILIDEKLRAGGIFHSMSEENLGMFLSMESVMIGSDSSTRCREGITAKGKPHPRGFGSFPAFIGRLCRDNGLMSLPEAVKKVTSLPAKTFGIKKRGYIKEGYQADITIFAPEKLIDRATYDEPFKKPLGIETVIINGAVAVQNGEPTGDLSGKVLRNGA